MIDETDVGAGEPSNTAVKNEQTTLTCKKLVTCVDVSMIGTRACLKEIRRRN